ncbi:MAG: radical SAM protein [Phycisphaerales bacterium]|nr:radical SAM protein [Phycisphaerales bacterium]
MSGIRVCDTRLLEMGLTLPGFVERSKVIAALPSLGLLTLAGMTPAQHECVYIEVEDIAAMKGLPTGLDLVAISSYSAQMGEAYELADRFCAQGSPVVLGGLHVTAVPDEAAQHADAVVVGEGEATWLNVLDDAQHGRLQPMYRSDGSYDLAASPMPAFDLLDISKYNRLTVQTSRGCPMRCEFCASSTLLIERYKQKPIPVVLAEIDRICELWSRPFVEFADDNAFVDKQYWRELLPELAQRHVRWFAETDLSVHKDDELLTLLRDAGCVELLIGFESPTSDALAGLELRSDWKAAHSSEHAEAVRRIQSHGIRVNGCFILGLDGHTPDIFDAVYDFARTSGLFDVQITYLTPFPGTPVYDRLKREGRLLDETAWDRCTLFDVNYQPRDMTVEQLRDGFHRLTTRLYGEEETRRRKDYFNRHCARRR